VICKRINSVLLQLYSHFGGLHTISSFIDFVRIFEDTYIHEALSFMVMPMVHIKLKEILRIVFSLDS
jgi:hypothetical protein